MMRFQSGNSYEPHAQPPLPPRAAALATDLALTNTAIAKDIIAEAIALATSAEWISDFLFRTTSRAEALALTTPLPLAHAFTASLSVASEPSAGGVFHSRLQSVFVPLFAVAEVTAGLCMDEVVRDEFPLAFATQPHLHLWRYIRDGRGTLLLFGENPDEAFSALEIMVIRSPTLRVHAQMRFDRNLFRTALDKCPRASLLPNLRAALSSCLVTEDRRTCPMCGIHPQGKCDCEWTFARPVHPLDLSKESYNMLPHIGHFDSSACFQMHTAGRTVLSLDFASNTSVFGGTNGTSSDEEMVSRMTRQFAQIRLSSLDSNPVNLLMPFGTSDDGDEQGTSTDVMDGSDGLWNDGQQLESDECDMTKEQERKAQIRREKNRASAARSNLKRKIQTEALRKELDSAKQQMEDMLTRERELRKENCRLRGLRT